MAGSAARMPKPLGGAPPSPFPEVEMAVRLTAFVVVAIVAATLIAGLIVGAQRDDNDGPVDLIVHNARVYTATPKGTMAEAVAIRGNQILRVGSEREITRLQRPQTTMIDAGGAAVVPGFNDAEVHPGRGGLSWTVWTSPARSRLRGHRAAGPNGRRTNPDRVIAGGGWMPEAFTDGPPTRQMLDRLVLGSPRAGGWLSADGRTAWVELARTPTRRRLSGGAAATPVAARAGMRTPAIRPASCTARRPRSSSISLPTPPPRNATTRCPEPSDGRSTPVRHHERPGV